MATKLTAAKIATFSGADMVIANGKDVRIIYDVFQGNFVGTTFHANPNPDFQLEDLKL
jgi:glutamate 5-kinase